MISKVTGEIHFEDLFDILPLQRLPFTLADKRAFQINGWTTQNLEIHISDHGIFDVYAITDSEHRVRVVWLSHHHPRYTSGTPENADRLAFHEAVIIADLDGQREFSWGCVQCTRNWLLVLYSSGLHVPIRDDPHLGHLVAYEADPFPFDFEPEEQHVIAADLRRANFPLRIWE